MIGNSNLESREADKVQVNVCVWESDLFFGVGAYRQPEICADRSCHADDEWLRSKERW